MAKLKNILQHMRNAKVQVNGNVYDLNSDGEMEITDEIAISHLLQNSAWRKVINRNPIISRTPIKASVDYSKMHKEEIIALLNYSRIQFDSKAKKSELVELAQQISLGE